MANFIQFSIGVTLILTFLSLVNVNSAPAGETTNVYVPVDELMKKHECYTDLECGHGKCSNETGICHCERGWKTHGNITGKTGYCNYDQSSKVTAFLLSILAGAFGADWFYLSRSNLGYIIAGIFKLLLGVGCCVAWLFTYFGPEIQNSEAVKAKLRGIGTFFTLLACTWWMVDWVRVLGNRFRDGNDAELLW